jgi:hypothetical protein
MKTIFAVVIAGPWRRGPRVIVPAESLGVVDSELKEIPVSLTSEQVKSAHRRDISSGVHMRSVREIGEYTLWGPDAKLGEIKDFMVADQDWSVPYMVIDMHDGAEIKKVTIPTSSITSINWFKKRVHTYISRKLLQTSPCIPLEHLSRSAKRRMD